MILNALRRSLPKRLGRSAWAGLQRIAGTYAEVAVRAKGGPPLQRVLVVSDGRNYTSEEQFAPFRRFAKQLAQDFGLVFRFVDVATFQKMKTRQVARYSFVGLKMSFLTPETTVLSIISDIRSRMDATGRLIYFDGDDDLNVIWPRAIEACDLWVKKHVFSDLGDYRKSRIGKSNLTDYVANDHGWDFSADPIPTSSPLSQKGIDRLFLGWNIALDDKIVALAKASTTPSPDERDIDVSGRCHASPDIWIHPLRAPVVDKLQAMSSKMKSVAPSSRVSQAEYYDEMRSSKICVSPFGYGELCWRDFEAVICGCLLVKPDMAHLQTTPNIFAAGQTYIPVPWDFEGLDEACERMLANDGDRQAIVTKAYDILIQSHTYDWFKERVASMLQAVAAEPISRD